MFRLPGSLRWTMGAALLSLCLSASAQVQISAHVDQDSVTQDDTVELTVTVAGSGLSLATEPTLPALDGFQIAGSSAQQSISIVNGVMQTSMNYVYDLQPTRTGQLTIPPVKLVVRGRTHQTDAITVTVTGGTGRRNRALMPGSSPPPGFGPNSFDTPHPGKSAEVKQSVDHRTAYVGQQITYTFSFLQCEQLYGDVHYSPADTPGFVAEDLPNPPQSTERINGRSYTVQRRMKALFATAPGKHTVGQAGVTCTMDPMMGEEELVAEPVSIEVLPLPENGQPAGFSGAVGSFTVSLRVDRPVVRAGETVNCVVEVSGDGNIRSLGAPPLAVPDSVRLYKAGEKRTVRPGGGRGGSAVLGGVATFSYLLLPRQAGDLRLGPLSYSYFDPEARAYRTTTSQGVAIAVAPGSGATTPVVPADNLRPVRATLGSVPLRPLAAHLWYWLMLALPLLAVLWTAWQRWQDVRVLAAPAQARAGNALALAHKRLDLADRALAEGHVDAYYTQLHETLLDYIADRTGAPPSGLTADVAYDLLVAHGAETELAEVTRSLVERTAAGRFAPGAGDERKAQQLVVECRQTVSALQRQVKPDV